MAEKTLVSCKVDQAVKDALQRAADDDHRTLSSMVHKILADWVEAQQGKKAPE